MSDKIDLTPQYLRWDRAASRFTTSIVLDTYSNLVEVDLTFAELIAIILNELDMKYEPARGSSITKKENTIED